MNVGELIEELSRYPADTPVCVDNRDIYTVHCDPAYWDGPLHRLIQDESKKGKCYNIIGYEITDKGSKVCLGVMDLDDCLLNNPDLPVKFSLGNEGRDKSWRKAVEEEREEVRRIIKSVEENMKELE